jgi:hypothetical protein
VSQLKKQYALCGDAQQAATILKAQCDVHFSTRPGGVVNTISLDGLTDEEIHVGPANLDHTG